MQSKRAELVPIAKVVSRLDGPVAAIRDATPQALHHFTLADQVDQLVSASEAEPDLGFMARLLTLCSLPRTNPGDQHQYTRQNGPCRLILSRTGEYKLPFGPLPRLLMAWLSTEAVRTQSPVISLGDSLSEFMRTLGIYSSDGKAYRRLHDQMDRLFHSSVELTYEHQQVKRFVASHIVVRGEFWWDPKRPNDRSLWDSNIQLGAEFFNGGYQPSSSAQHERSRGAQALRPGPRFLLVVGLPHLRASRSAVALLADALPAVRSGPDQGGRQSHRAGFPHGLPARVEEDQTRLAGVELCDGQGRVDPLALETRDSTPQIGGVTLSTTKGRKMKRTITALAIALVLTTFGCQSGEEKQANELREALIQLVDEIEPLNEEAIATVRKLKEVMDASPPVGYREPFEFRPSTVQRDLKRAEDRPGRVAELRKVVEKYTAPELPRLAPLVRSMREQAEKNVESARQKLQKAEERKKTLEEQAAAPKKPLPKRTASPRSRNQVSSGGAERASSQPAVPKPDPAKLREEFRKGIDVVDALHGELIEHLKTIQEAQTDMWEKRWAGDAVTKAQFTRRHDGSGLQGKLERADDRYLDSVKMSIEFSKTQVEQQITNALSKLKSLQPDSSPGQ